MTVLLTQCPHCQTSFRVSTAQLNAANGLVRCGSCLGVFSASANEIRIKHPDGYVVEELASADELQEEHWSPPEENSPLPAETAEELLDEPVNVQVHEPVNEQEHAQAETTDWHYDERAVSLGDMQLDDDYLADDRLATHEAEPEEVASDDAQGEPDNDYVQESEYDEESAYQEDSGYEEDTAPVAAPVEDDMLLDEYAEDEDATPTEAVAKVDEPLKRESAEKRSLRAHLSTLADADALDPVDDNHLDALEALPVTITNNDRSRLAQVVLLLLNIVLLLALPVPWLYTHRDELSTHRRFSFMAPIVCKVVTCAPPVTAKVTTLYSQQLLVRTHPRFEGALEVSFVFHNDSTLPQRFPNVELAFSDVDNTPLANRLFMPQEYLPPELRQLAEMPANSSVQVLLEVADPGQSAVNYTVKLHTP